MVFAVRQVSPVRNNLPFASDTCHRESRRPIIGDDATSIAVQFKCGVDMLKMRTAGVLENQTAYSV